jgi:hypothetical protein
VSQEGADKTKLTKIAQLVELEADLLEKLAAVHAEMRIILAGGPTIGARLRQLEEAWRVTWGVRYPGGKYQFNKTIDVPAQKRLLREFTPAELMPRMQRYLADDFYAARRHPFAAFAADINRWAAEASDPDAPEISGEAPHDCKHVPPCRSDAEHTARRRQDRRA